MIEASPISVPILVHGINASVNTKGKGGLADRGGAQNCVHACPKGASLTEIIAEMGRQVTVRAVRRPLGG